MLKLILYVTDWNILVLKWLGESWGMWLTPGKYNTAGWAYADKKAEWANKMGYGRFGQNVVASANYSLTTVGDLIVTGVGTVMFSVNLTVRNIRQFDRHNKNLRSHYSKIFGPMK